MDARRLALALACLGVRDRIETCPDNFGYKLCACLGGICLAAAQGC